MKDVYNMNERGSDKDYQEKDNRLTLDLTRLTLKYSGKHPHGSVFHRVAGLVGKLTFLTFGICRKWG